MVPPGDPHPPGAFRWALSLLAAGDGSEYLQGDLEEEFRRRAARTGLLAARRWYRWHALTSIVAWWNPLSWSARRRLKRQRRAHPVETAQYGARRWPAGFLGRAVRSSALPAAVGAVMVIALVLGMLADAPLFQDPGSERRAGPPLQDQGRLVFVHAVDRHGQRYQQFTFPEVDALRTDVAALTDLAGYSTAQRLVARPRSKPVQARVARVSARFFVALGVPVHLGRAVTAEEYRDGADVVLLSFGLWSRFGGDSSIVGSTISIRDTPLRVVGVLPADFGFPTDADIWRPASRWLRQDNDREVSVLARVAADITVAEASAQVAMLIRNLRIARYSPAGVYSAWIELVP